jgi:hypothetical protein
VGWEGYFWINTTPYPNAAPSACPDGSQPATYFDGPASAECSPCTCGNWAGAACGAPPLECWNQSANCAGNQEISLFGLATDGTCFNVSGINQQAPRSCRLTGAAQVMDSGACPPGGGALLASDLWMNQDDVCGLPLAGGGCSSDQACVPKGSGDYSGPACIRKIGQDACPNTYPNLIEAATSAMDDRMCNACDCAVSGVICAGGGYTVYDQDGCMGASTANVNSMNCVDVTAQLDNSTGSINAVVPQPINGSCSPSGGQPSGSVTPQGVVTYCCN